MELIRGGVHRKSSRCRKEPAVAALDQSIGDIRLLIGSCIRPRNGRRSPWGAFRSPLGAALPALNHTGAKRRIQNWHRPARRRSIPERPCRPAGVLRFRTTPRPFLLFGGDPRGSHGLQDARGQVWRPAHGAGKVPDEVEAGNGTRPRARVETTLA